MIVVNKSGHPLPEPYQSMAQSKKGKEVFRDNHDLNQRFIWMYTFEKRFFWVQVHLGLAPKITKRIEKFYPEIFSKAE